MKNALSKLDVSGRVFFADATTGPLISFYLAKGRDTKATEQHMRLQHVECSVEIVTLSTIGWDDLRKQVQCRTIQSMLAELMDEEAALQARLDYVKEQKDTLKRKSEVLDLDKNDPEGLKEIKVTPSDVKETKVTPSDAPNKSPGKGSTSVFQIHI
eukprot:s43_g10.t1